MYINEFNHNFKHRYITEATNKMSELAKSIDISANMPTFLSLA